MHFSLIFGFLFFLVAFPTFAEEATLTDDATQLKETVGKVRVIVNMTSQVKSLADVAPDMEPSQFPSEVRVLTSLSIRVNGSKIFVPRSAFASLIAVSTAKLEVKKNGGQLTFSGGDASECYFVQLEFNLNHVKTRSLFSCLIPSLPVEETRYFVRELK